MISDKKVSQTILEFGRPLFSQLPDGHSKEEFEALMGIVITCWNTVNMDRVNGNTAFEETLLSTMQNEREGLIQCKRLIKRKKLKFPKDSWGVGFNWIREDENGEFIFGCEAHDATKKQGPKITH